MADNALMGPNFEPPYDSPIEQLFAVNAIKYLGESVTLAKQVEAPTPWGTFRMDFVANGKGPQVAVECDGKEFHEEFRDEFRDALLLGTGAVDTIYHFRGSDLTYHLEDLLYLMSRWDPHLFSERGTINLGKLASEQVKAYGESGHTGGTTVVYPPPDDYRTRGVTYIDVDRRSRHISAGTRQHWTYLYARAQGYNCRTLDELLETHRAWMEGKKSQDLNRDK